MFTSTIPVFSVEDIGESVQWYRDVLGFKPISNGERAAESMVLMARDDVEVMLQKEDGGDRGRGEAWDAYFRLTGVDTLYRKIRNKAEVVRIPEDTCHQDREIEIKDPNGYVLAFGEWEKRQDEVVSMYDLHPVLPVGDIEETVQWYKKVLGFQGEAWPEEPPSRFAMLYRDNVEIFFSKVAKFTRPVPEPGAWDVYVRLVDGRISRLYTEIKEKVTILRHLSTTAYGYSEFEIADNNGHVLCFSELVPSDV